MTTLLLLPLLTGAAAASLVIHAGAAMAAEDGPAAGSNSLQQAKHYYKKGLLREALQAIKGALATEAGRQDAKVQLLAAQIYRDRGEIDLAFRAISKAQETGNATERASADEIYKALTRSFGEVRILPAGGVHVKGRIYLESEETFINLQRKTLFKAVQRALLVNPRRYPDSIWIPYGEYKANGANFKHEAGGRTEVVVPFPTIAIVRSDDLAADKPPILAFRSRVGGVTEVYNLEGELTRGKQIVESLRKKKPQLIVALGAKAAVLCRKELRHFPLVFGMVEDDWRLYDLRQGGQATGVALYPPPEQVIARLRRVLPDARRIGVLFEPAHGGEERLAELKAALQAAQLAFVPGEISSPAVLPGTLAALRDQVDVLWMMPDPPLAQLASFQLLLREELAAGKPVVVPSGELVRSGAFLAVEGERKALGIQMAGLARQILFGGISPSELAVEDPQRLDWHLNRAVAAKLGLPLAQSLLSEIDQVHDKLPSLETK